MGRGRHKLTEEEKTGWVGKNYYFTSERGVREEKRAKWDSRGLIIIIYNFGAKVKDGVVPNLYYMQEITKRRVESTLGKCIYVLDGGVSKGKNKERYFINAQLMIRMKDKPTEQQLKRLEQLITNVKYEDDKGRNEWNTERLMGRADRPKGNGCKATSKNQPILARNVKTGEEVVFSSVLKMAETINVTPSAIYHHMCGRGKTVGGYECRYLS